MVNTLLKNALEGIAPVRFGEFRANRNERISTYIVVKYNVFPANYGDDEPEHEVYFVQVHLFCPSGFNSFDMRKKIRKALSRAGLTWPSVVDASGDDGQHYVFECQIAFGIEVE